MKKYIKVNADFTAFGDIIPKHIEWEGQIYEVQKVYESARAASTKAGGTGIRYRCQIKNKERYLFLEDCEKANSVFGARWFVEADGNKDG